MSKLNLTAKQFAIMDAIAHGEYHESNGALPASLSELTGTWTWIKDWAAAADTTVKSARGMVGALTKKGFITTVDAGTENSTTTFTQAGWDAWIEYRKANGMLIAEVVTQVVEEKKEEAPKKPRKEGAKAFVRRVLNTAEGKGLSMLELMDGRFTETSIKTALSDLKNAKYAGAEGPLDIERVRGNDGVYTWTLKG